MLLCSLVYSLIILLYLSPLYGWSQVSFLAFGGAIFGGSFLYIRCGIISITLVLWSPTIAWKDKFAPFLIHISHFPHTKSIFFVLRVGVTCVGSSVYFCFLILPRPIPSPSGDLCSWLSLVSGFLPIFISIDPTCSFHYLNYSRSSPLYTLGRHIFIPIDTRNFICCWCTVMFFLGYILLCGL